MEDTEITKRKSSKNLFFFVSLGVLRGLSTKRGKFSIKQMEVLLWLRGWFLSLKMFLYGNDLHLSRTLYAAPVYPGPFDLTR